jgi:Uma2 family endonuclease
MMTRRAARVPILGHARRATVRAEERASMQTAPSKKRWTLDEVHALPEDGNKYELVHGELWVTPAPTNRHETILARLNHVLVPYVEAHGLGLVFRPHAVFRVGREVEVEPDLMVRQPHPDRHGSWETAPRPILVVEVLSPSTRRRDRGRKRDLYVEEQIPEYWIVDGDAETITVVVSGRDPAVVVDRMTWAPEGASEALTFALAAIFG